MVSLSKEPAIYAMSGFLHKTLANGSWGAWISYLPSRQCLRTTLDPRHFMWLRHLSSKVVRDPVLIHLDFNGFIYLFIFIFKKRESSDDLAYMGDHSPPSVLLPVSNTQRFIRGSPVVELSVTETLSPSRTVQKV